MTNFISPKLCKSDPGHGHDQDIDDLTDEAAEAGVRTPAKIADPVLPTQSEIDEHMKTHLPYRSWCSHCVRGRGQAADHRQQEREEHVIPEFHMDYMFMGTERVQGAHDHKAATILGVKERDRRMHMSTVVPEKGGSADFVAKRVLAFIAEMGCQELKITIKTDQEAAFLTWQTP